MKRVLFVMLFTFTCFLTFPNAIIAGRNSTFIGACLTNSFYNSSLVHYGKNDKPLGICQLELDLVKLPTNYPIKAIFLTADRKILQSNDSILVNIELTRLANAIKIYYSSNNIFVSDDFQNASTYEIIMFGMIQFANELYKEATLKNEVNRIATDPRLDCLIGVISGVIGIGELIHDFSALINGTFHPGTVFGLIKKVAKKYFIWVTLAYGIYQIGGCFDLW